MTKEEQIKELTEKLLALMAPDMNQPALKTPQPESHLNNLTLNEVNTYAKTINDLKNGLNVEVDVVRRIMKRVDEVYGKCENYQYTAPLYEDFERILKG
jgi:hypothetical protein